MTLSIPTGRPSTSGRRRWSLLGVLLLLLAGAVAGVWWWLRPSAAVPADPPMPPDIQDAEVRHTIERARQKILDNRHSADAWGQLGMVLLAHLFDKESDRCFAEAARLHPTDPRWPYGRARIALKRDPGNALPLLRQAAAASDPRSSQESCYRLELAETLLDRQQLDEAEKLFREERRRHRANLRAALGLGLVARARGDQRAAADFLTAARASPHARKLATAQLAALARARGDTAAADAYEREAAAPPDDTTWPDPFLDQIMQLRVGHRRSEREVSDLEREHRYTEAAQRWLQLLQEHPTPDAYVGAGINLARIKDYEKALPLLREGMRLDPNNAKAHYSLAVAQFSRAEEEWQQSPGSAQAKEWLGEAVTHARRATELKPDHAFAYLIWGLALKYLDQPAAAVVPLRKGVACRPESLELQLGLGEALLESGQDREATTHLENARRLDPNDTRPIRDLERLRAKKG